MAALFRSPPLRDGTLVIDQTGVGKAVIDLFRKAALKAPICRVTITTRLCSALDGTGGWLVPRKELVGVMQVLLQGRRLQIARSLAEAELLTRELANFKARVTATTQDPVAAWREGEHDDLVLAIAVAAGQAERSQTFRAWFSQRWVSRSVPGTGAGKASLVPTSTARTGVSKQPIREPRAQAMFPATIATTATST